MFSQHYSDADIVLSKDWVPPVTIAPTHHSLSNDTESPARKKTNSVSFSLDSSSDADTSSTAQFSTSLIDSKDDSEKSESRKNKVSFYVLYLEVKLSLFEVE